MDRWECSFTASCVPARGSIQGYMHSFASTVLVNVGVGWLLHTVICFPEHGWACTWGLSKDCCPRVLQTKSCNWIRVSVNGTCVELNIGSGHFLHHSFYIRSRCQFYDSPPTWLIHSCTAPRMMLGLLQGEVAHRLHEILPCLSNSAAVVQKTNTLFHFPGFLECSPPHTHFYHWWLCSVFYMHA